MFFRCLPLLLLAVAAKAQNDLQAAVNLQFRFINPGARAQAMGGAFAGLADDTTAIFANPAGLALLRSGTIILEANHTDRDNRIPFYAGRVEQTGLQDFRFDLEERGFPEQTTSIPFAAYVHNKGRLRWGVFYAEQANFERSFATEGLAIPAYRFGRDVAQNRFEIFPPSENFIELKMQGLGASAGIKLSEKWSAGLTLAYQRLDYRGNSTLIFPDPRVLFPEVNFPPREIEAIEPFIGQTFAVIDVDGEDEALAIYGGLLFTPSDRFRIGLSFKRQPDFDYSYLTSGRDDDFNLVPEESGNASFAIPDNYALGFSFQATDSVLLSVELNRVLYSQLSDEFVAFFSSDQDPSRATQTAADATEYHVGLEYFIATLQYPLALRMGYWFEPYHALQNTSLDTQLLYRYFDEDIGNYLQGSRPTVFLQRFAHDLNHFTVGFGMTLNNRVVLDLSGDIDEENTSISFSSIYRF